MADRTERLIQTLEPRTAEAAVAMVNAAREAGYPLVITSARRSLAEQKALFAAGRSKTMASKHLEGKAFDVDLQGWNRSDIPRWFWDLLGPWAESVLRLRWGGRFKSLWDPGHFEL